MVVVVVELGLLHLRPEVLVAVVVQIFSVLVQLEQHRRVELVATAALIT
jgi:hypothetical protein